MIRGVKIVSIPVRNQDVALKFYTEKVGFKVATDQPFGPGQRWIELLIPGADTTLALFTPRVMKTGLAASNQSHSGATTFCDSEDPQIQRGGIDCRAEERSVGNDGEIQRPRWQ